MKIIYSRINKDKYINFAAINATAATEKIDTGKQSVEQFAIPVKQDKFVQKDFSKNSNGKFSVSVLATTIVGTLIPILLIRKAQIKKGQLKGFNKETLSSMDLKTKAMTVIKSFNVNYELKEMLTVSASSIAGGLVGGLLFDKNKEKSNKLAKLKESVFQIFNVGVPIVVGDFAVKFANKKNWTGAWVKLAAPILAIGAGMPVGAKISNTINNKIIDKENPDKRKLKIKDTFVHVDDFAGVLVLSKVPFADKIQCVLPFLYGMCGYEAGHKKSSANIAEKQDVRTNS